MKFIKDGVIQCFHVSALGFKRIGHWLVNGIEFLAFVFEIAGLIIIPALSIPFGLAVFGMVQLLQDEPTLFNHVIGSGALILAIVVLIAVLYIFKSIFSFNNNNKREKKSNRGFTPKTLDNRTKNRRKKARRKARRAKKRGNTSHHDYGCGEE